MMIETAGSASPEADFAAFLSERLGVPNDEAKGLLKRWLLTYEPDSRRPLRFLSGGSVVELPPASPASR